MAFNYRDPSTYGGMILPQEEPPWEPSLEELAQMFSSANQAPPPPGFLDRLAMGFQNVQGPSWGPGAALAGFAQGFAGARMGAMGARERALARQNQANLAATQAHIQARLQSSGETRRRLGQRAETIDTENRAQARRTADQDRARAEAADPILTPEQTATYGLEIGLAGKRVSQLTPEQRARVKPKGSGFMSDVMADTDPDAIAQAIIDNRMPPDLSGFGRYVQGQVASKLAQRGYNLTRASADWKAANRFYSSLNTSLQLRLRQAIENAHETASVASGLHDELNKALPRGQFTLANKALRKLAEEGAYGPEATARVQKLVSFVNALQFELANVYMGGGVPTDVAQEKAHQIINPDMSPVRLRAALEAANQELGIRRLAIQQAGMVSPSNPPTGIPQTEINIGENPMQVGRTVRMVAPDGRLLNVPAEKVAEAEKRGARRR